MHPTNGAAAVFAGAALLLATSGCTALGVASGVGATVGVAAVQERSMQDAARDAGIQIEINHRLLQHDHEMFARTGIAVVEGRVLLTGALGDAAGRAEAGRIARGVAGVREVLNEIQVSPSAGPADYGRDAWITAKLRTKLMGDALISDINYTIETVHGVIYLIGIAQDGTELGRVLAHARTIGGARRVVSHVRVRNDPRRRAT